MSFLKSYPSTSSNSNIASLSGGKYYVPTERMHTFLESYFMNLQNGVPMYLVEKPPRDNYRFFLDLDVPFDHPIADITKYYKSVYDSVYNAATRRFPDVLVAMSVRNVQIHLVFPGIIITNNNDYRTLVQYFVSECSEALGFDPSVFDQNANGLRLLGSLKCSDKDSVGNSTGSTKDSVRSQGTACSA